MAETRALTLAGSEFSIAGFRLRVTGGADVGAVVDATGDELAVGTAEGNDLVLSDTAVSRHHVAVRATVRGYRLIDLGSTNGTWVGPVRVERGFIEPGTELRVGHTTVRFEQLADEIRGPVASDDRYGDALGASPAMRRIFAVLPRLAATDTTLLIEGETGTGKSMLAGQIHAASPRAAARFAVLDCSAIPPTLIESELFGHVKGAFTGAHTSRAGIFEAASGGTVFLDEIGELPPDMQPKLLRALEERVVRRVGATDSVDLDVRIIAATNRDLRQQVNAGSFRSDLFYRLNVVKLRIPPLRERREDIPLLVAHFHEQLAGGKPPAELVTSLLAQDWPGNVRELRSAVERMLLLDDPELWRQIAGDDVTIEQADTPVSVAYDWDLSFRAAKELATSSWERSYLEALMARHDGNQSAAARAAKMDRNSLRERLRKYGLR